MAGASVVLVSDAKCLAHATGEGHPEAPARLVAIARRLGEDRLGGRLAVAAPRPASWETVRLAHDEEYLMRFEEAALSGRSYLDHRDNQMSEASFEVALLAAGAGPTGVDLVEAGRAATAFCAVRPPGHHAERGRALGFCFFNNAAIAVRHWQRAHGRRRVLVLDFDAHHGNGIQSAFEADPDVLYVSLHEHPTFSFPGTGFAEERGIGPGEGATLNVPLLPGSRDGDFLEALEGKVESVVTAFDPEAIVVAAGFDGHELDDMSGLGFSTDLYHRVGLAVGEWSRRHCGGRVVSLLEGGYHLEALAASVEQYLRGLSWG